MLVILNESFFWLVTIWSNPTQACDYWRSEETTRGRHEIRDIWATEDLDWFPQKDHWKDLRSLVCLRLTRTPKGKKTVETRSYICNLNAELKSLAKQLGSHWSFENNLHWQLDVTYREDLSRVRRGNGAENLSVVRRAILNLLKEGKETKVGMKNTRLKAGWDRKYLLRLIGVN